MANNPPSPSYRSRINLLISSKTLQKHRKIKNLFAKIIEKTADFLPIALRKVTPEVTVDV